MNKLTKVLIIIAVTGFFLGCVAESPVIALSAPVICAAAYLISKVLASGPSSHSAIPEIPLDARFTGSDEELMNRIAEGKRVIAHLEMGLHVVTDAERPTVETALETARRYLQRLELECERRAQDYTMNR